MMVLTTPPNIIWVVAVTAMAAAELIIHHQNQCQYPATVSPLLPIDRTTHPHNRATLRNRPRVAASWHSWHTSNVTVNWKIYCCRPLNKPTARPSARRDSSGCSAFELRLSGRYRSSEPCWILGYRVSLLHTQQSNRRRRSTRRNTTERSAARRSAKQNGCG